ncbi:hypothetical protein CPA43_01955 [Staphylococcus warneri]|uniref:hypothetical protein n=1 Tax=Staphylococcus warneri TaxID=1292 RepID=UPI000F53F655|nr:hypothetical protein [Staphylococcus warneri]RQN00195.1 hypothetical protein CPA43_01955 [Staphylococcus warneri]
MIDNIILYFKNLPHLLTYTLKRIKSLWKWFTLSFIVGLVFILIAELFFKFTNATEVIHGIWLYRLITLFAFIFIMLTLYGCYRLYAKDYLITKFFHITPVTPTVITTIVGSVVIFILMTIIALLKPINYESSLLATLFFLFVSIVLISLLSVTFGLLKILNYKIDKYFYIFCVVEFLILPIIYMPKTHLTLIEHLLMLNPLYYIVNGLAQSVLFGNVSVANLPYHLYMLCFIAIISIINFALSRYVAHAKYRNQNIKLQKVIQSNDEKNSLNEINNNEKVENEQKK